MTEPTTVTRSLRVDVFAADDERQRVLSSIRAYRAALRHAYAILALSHDAAADIVWTGDDVTAKPANDSAKLIAALATRQSVAAKLDRTPDHKRGDGTSYAVKINNGAVYELRAELVRQLPTCLTFVVDGARRDIGTAWAARDPQFTRASRGWLRTQGARHNALFTHRGIQFPVATAKPKFEGNKLRLRWDRDIGELEFSLGKLDPGRWRVWAAIRDGQWTPGTIYLSERDGKLFATISYTCPMVAASVDPERICTASIVDATGDPVVIWVAGPDGATTCDTIEGAAVRAFLAQSLQKRTDLEERRGSTGQPRRPWGFRKGWEAVQKTLDRATLQRERVSADYNHCWTRRIVARCASWKCGTLRLGPCPQQVVGSGPPTGCLCGHPWNWTQFREFLTYKAAESGVELTCDD